MNLSYSDEQNMLREQVLKFCESDYTFDVREKIVESNYGHNPETWKQFADLGWLAVPFKEDNGGFNFGPGWRFVNTGNAGWGTSSTGPFTMRFRVTVASTCTPDDLSISIEVFDDCTTGGWSNGGCCIDPAYNIYNGVVQLPPITTSNINHF